MALNSATQTRYGQEGVKESLTNKIYDVSPMDTPFMTAVGRGKAAKNTKEEWQIDSLDEPSENAALDGDAASYSTASQTVKLANHTQIFQKAVSVSGTADAVSTAGRSTELAYQVDKRTKEVKRDIEFAITQNRASQVGSTATGRKLAGFEAWITTNSNRGTGGDDGGFTTSTQIVSAATDASSSNLRTFTEARFKSALASVWTNSDGSVAPLVLVGAHCKEQASAFSGIAQVTNNVDSKTSTSQVAIHGAADIYKSDYGTHKIMLSRWSRARSALLLDPKKWEMRYLRPFKVAKLAKVGDAENRQLIAEATLVSKNEACAGVVADLLTS